MQIQRFIRLLAASLLVAMITVGCVDIRAKAKGRLGEIEIATYNGYWEEQQDGTKICKLGGKECRAKDPASSN